MAKKITQTALVLDWLKRNGELTTRDAVTELNIMSVAKRIQELREKGHRIGLYYKKSSSGAKYGVYFLIPPVSGDYADGHPQNW